MLLDYNLVKKPFIRIKNKETSFLVILIYYFLTKN